MSERMTMKLRHLTPPIEGRLHLEYTHCCTIWQFLKLSFKTSRLKNWITEIPQTVLFTELQYLSVF